MLGTKIYVCETYHDNDSGIYSTLEAAVAFAKDLSSCVQEIVEMELDGNKFISLAVYNPDGSLNEGAADWCKTVPYFQIAV